MKVVINVVHGGFGLSEYALKIAIEEVSDVIRSRPQKLGEVTVDAGGGFQKNVAGFAKTLYRDGTAFSVKTPARKERACPILVKIVEEMGDAVNTEFSKLKVVEIPDDVEWEIEEYDGVEWVSEKHRTWS